MTAMQFGDGKHQWMEWRHITAHDGLQRENHRGERFDRTGALVRVAGMRARSVERDMEFHASGHHGVRADGNLPGRIVGVVVRADDGGDIGQQSRVDHGACAGACFFGRLEQQFDGSLDLFAVFGKPECRSQQI